VINKRGMQITIAIILCILMTVITAEAKSLFFREETEEELSAFESTKKDYEQELEANQIREETADRLKNEYDARIKALGDNEIELRIKELYDDLSKAELIAGLTEVSGSGIVFSINDRSRQDVMINEIDQGLLIVHSYQVFSIINELKKAGAQAISINGERIIASSEIFCTGGNIKINGHMNTPPYVITAIGNPDHLHKGIIDSEIYTEITGRRLRVTLNKENNLVVPKYSGISDNITNTLTEVVKEEIR